MKYVNARCIEKPHKCELVNQFKNRVTCSKPIQDVNSVIHVNRFEVLTNEIDGFDNDVTSNANVVVEVSDECECLYCS